MLNSLSKRRTHKVIGDPANPENAGQEQNSLMQRLLEAAGNAPFHYACDRQHQLEMSSPVPWRAYILDTENCRNLMAELLASGDTTKIPNMLAATRFLVQVTWLPDPGTLQGEPMEKDQPDFEGTQRNMEHIAAASAFIQSLLLAAIDAGFKTYWSSGGPLRTRKMFRRLCIPENQMLLGSVFLFPDELKNGEIRPGAMVAARGGVSDWSRSLQLT
ncbi:MAG: hypothetical protein ACR2O3_06105 [Rhizobiaceae bacterium]